MKIKANNTNIFLNGEGDYIITKESMFDGRECELHLTLDSFSGCVGLSNKTIPDVAEWMGYSKFQIWCFRILARVFNFKNKFADSCFVKL